MTEIPGESKRLVKDEPKQGKKSLLSDWDFCYPEKGLNFESDSDRGLSHVNLRGKTWMRGIWRRNCLQCHAQPAGSTKGHPCLTKYPQRMFPLHSIQQKGSRETCSQLWKGSSMINWMQLLLCSFSAVCHLTWRRVPAAFRNKSFVQTKSLFISAKYVSIQGLDLGFSKGA